MNKNTMEKKNQAAAAATQAALQKEAALTAEALLQQLGSSAQGLTADQVEKNRETYGENKVTQEKKKSVGVRLAEAFINPFTVILFVLAGVSAVTDIILPLMQNRLDDYNPATVIIITVLVLLSGSLRFIQETRSGDAAAKLLELITTTCTVIRQPEGQTEIPLEDVVVGDLVFLSAGDMVPADLRILEAKDLFVSQASLTGESAPQEKVPAVAATSDKAVTELSNLAFMGTNVISGSATGLVLRSGDHTLFGSLASSMAQEAPETNFTKGVNAVSWILIRFMMAMVPIVFVVNGLTKGDWLNAFLFGISVAVGLTPEMLPMIVTTCLAKGAVSMSEKKTVVKSLNSIQSFGAMDVLCTDKTGTLTQDRVALEYHLDAFGKPSQRVLRYAYLNSYFQTGYKNFMDRAIIARTEREETEDPKLQDLSETYTKVDEIPFDFSRRRLSVLVMGHDHSTRMITKGAVEEMLSICKYTEQGAEDVPMTDELRKTILAVADRLNDEGMRVIGLARKNDPSPVGAFGAKDETDMIFMGYLAFLDPPKDTAMAAIKALKDHGVSTKVLTGDNEKTTRCICRQVGLPVDHILLGSDLEHMDDATLQKEAETTTVFAKLSPDQKARVVEALQAAGHTVGFMGDGINDAPALKIADIGISVDSAVDIAKESADIILLEKSLMVLEQGIVEGRKTYANMIKYSQCPFALPAHDESAINHLEPGVRNLLHRHSLGQRGRGIPQGAPELGRFHHWQLHDLDGAHQFGVRLDYLSGAVLCDLSPVCVRRPDLQPDSHYGDAYLRPHGRPHRPGRLRSHVPGRLVCGIHVDPDPGYPHDPHPQDSLPAKSCVGYPDHAHLRRHCRADGSALYGNRPGPGFRALAGKVLLLPGPGGHCLYAAGHQRKESVYPALRHPAVVLSL